MTTIIITAIRSGSGKVLKIQATAGTTARTVARLRRQGYQQFTYS